MICQQCKHELDAEKELNIFKAKHEVAMKVLNQIASMPRKTREQRQANACVQFLESMK